MMNSDGKMRRFSAMKTEWGFEKLISLDTFNDSFKWVLGLVINVMFPKFFWEIGRRSLFLDQGTKKLQIYLETQQLFSTIQDSL